MSGEAGGTLAFFSELLAGSKARDSGQTQYKWLRSAARGVGIEARAAEAALRRQTRRQFGELRASGAQAGLSSSASFMDAYAQSAAEAELDALNLRYSGESQRQGLIYESKLAQAARPTWGQIFLSAGARALSSSPSMFGGTPNPNVPVVSSKPSYVRG